MKDEQREVRKKDGQELVYAQMSDSSSVSSSDEEDLKERAGYAPDRHKLSERFKHGPRDADDSQPATADDSKSSVSRSTLATEIPGSNSNLPADHVQINGVSDRRSTLGTKYLSQTKAI